MRKLLWIFLLGSCFGQQVNTDILPASTGLNLGHSNQRWNGFFQNLDILGVCTINGVPCLSQASISPGTVGNLSIYSSTSSISSDPNIDDGVTTPGVVTVDIPLAAPQINLTGPGGGEITSPGGALTIPLGSNGGVGIGPGGIPQFNPNKVGWFNIPNVQDCGSTSTCANTQKSLLMVMGRVSFPTATTITITSLPFTSATSYVCHGQDVTTAAGVINATTYTSGAQVIFTETGGTNTDAMRFSCEGF